MPPTAQSVARLGSGGSLVATAGPVRTAERVPPSRVTPSCRSSGEPTPVARTYRRQPKVRDVTSITRAAEARARGKRTHEGPGRRRISATINAGRLLSASRPEGARTGTSHLDRSRARYAYLAGSHD